MPTHIHINTDVLTHTPKPATPKHSRTQTLLFSEQAFLYLQSCGHIHNKLHQISPKHKSK